MPCVAAASTAASRGVSAWPCFDLTVWLRGAVQFDATMNKNQYDTDVTTWSPQGRLFQVEYAMEAVKQGSASVGLISDTFAVLVSLRR